MIINKNSWHYKVARKFGDFIENYDNHDICTYSRKVMLGLLKILIGSLALLLGSIVVIQIPLATIVWSLGYVLRFFGPLVKDSFWYNTVSVGAGILLMYFVTVVCAVGKVLIERAQLKRDPNKVSFVAEAYRAWKGKYCAKVDFK